MSTSADQSVINRGELESILLRLREEINELAQVSAILHEKLHALEARGATYTLGAGDYSAGRWKGVP